MNSVLLKRTKHRLSYRGWASMLRLLQIEQRTGAALAEAMDTSPRTIGQILRRMAGHGIVHEVAWVSAHGPRVPVWAFGGGKRAQCPIKQRQFKVTRWTRRPALLAFAHVIQAMAEGPTTRTDLCDLSGLNSATVRHLTDHCKAIGLARIADWYKPMSGPPLPMWAIGSSADKPRPAPKSNAENCRRYEQRRRAHDHIASIIPTLKKAATEPAIEEVAA